MLATGMYDHSNGDGNGGGGPVLATNTRHDNNGNCYVQGDGRRAITAVASAAMVVTTMVRTTTIMATTVTMTMAAVTMTTNGSNDNDNGSSNNNNNGSDDNNNGGNRGNSRGGCDTIMAVSIDKEDNNQLKVSMDNGCGCPRGGGRVLTTDYRHPRFPCDFLVRFLLLHFTKNVGGKQQSLPRIFFPAKRAGSRF